MDCFFVLYFFSYSGHFLFSCGVFKFLCIMLVWATLNKMMETINMQGRSTLVKIYKRSRRDRCQNRVAFLAGFRGAIAALFAERWERSRRDRYH